MYKNFLYFILIFPLLAGTTGKIKGQVIDFNTNEPLIGCNIYLSSTNYGASADIDGTYIILNIPAGLYELHASMIGYDEYIIKNIEVNIDLTTTINVSLNESSLEIESVVVNAAPKLINKNLTSTTAIVTQKTISKLPINEVSEILDLQAGFVDGHLRGGRLSEVAYWVDGMPMTDSYDGSTIIDINKDSIREMQLISGSFNAEYGQAMSGIVNITTNEGNNNFGGSLDIYSGDFISNHSNLYTNINFINILSTHNLNFNIHGSIVKNKLYYYLSGRYIYYQGVYEGQRVYNPWSYGVVNEGDWYVLGSNLSLDEEVNEDYCLDSDIDSCLDQLTQTHLSQNSLGDNRYIPMEWNLKKSGQLNLIWKPTQTTKIKYSHFTDNKDFQEYDRYYKLNPDANLLRYNFGQTNILQLNKSVNKNSFFSIGFTRYDKLYKHQTFENLSQNIHSDLNNQDTPLYSFSTGGANQNVFQRKTISNVAKFNYTNQVTNSHQLKLGVEYKKHSIFYEDINLQYDIEDFDPIYDSPFLIPRIDNISSINTSIYDFHPIEGSVYIQDKIEFDEMIINAGIRFDYFDPKGLILSDPRDPFIYSPLKNDHIYDCSNNDSYCGDNEPEQTLEDRLKYWYTPTKTKTMISPRIGGSFPISDQGVVHFSYGHFFQTPKFELLYYNSDINLNGGLTGNIGVIGNADLEPEKTISYEIGIQYKLDNKSAIDMTMYFRDIRDLTGTTSDIVTTYTNSTYYIYENSDFAFVKGLVLSYKKNFNNGFSTTIDYTFQQAKGTASDPFDTYYSALSNEYPEIQLIPLDWDQTHTINGTFYYDAKNFGVGMIGKVGSGQPYTPSINQEFSSLVNNSKSKPITWNVDLRSYFQLPNLNGTKFYINVFNIFDHLNHLNVYDDTGQANITGYEQDALDQNTDQLINTIEEWFNDETYYSSPRRIEIGLRLEFN